MTALPPIFFGIQMGLLLSAAGLLGGALYGMYLNGERISWKIQWHLPQWIRSSEQEKRRAARLKCNLFLELLDGERIAGTGRLINLSSSGACFESTKILHTGDPILARMPSLRKGANKISG